MIEEFEGEPTICSVCREYLAAKIIFGEVVCYDCALYYTEKFYVDYLQKMFLKVEKIKELYEEGIEDLKKEHSYQYNNLAQAFKEYISDLANDKPRTKRRKTKV